MPIGPTTPPCRVEITANRELFSAHGKKTMPLCLAGRFNEDETPRARPDGVAGGFAPIQCCISQAGLSSATEH